MRVIIREKKVPSKAIGKKSHKSKRTTKCPICFHRLISGDCGYCVSYKEV
jgi:hypothetical protein